MDESLCSGTKSASDWCDRRQMTLKYMATLALRLLDVVLSVKKGWQDYLADIVNHLDLGALGSG